MSSTNGSKKKKSRRNSPKQKSLPPVSKYRSKLEARVAADLGRKFEYEPYVIEYTQVKDYLVDFAYGKFIIEVKGFFRPGDSTKYAAISNACKEKGYEFIMLFANPYKPVRKDARTTYAQWADKRGIKWFGVDFIYKLKEYINEQNPSSR